MTIVATDRPSSRAIPSKTTEHQARNVAPYSTRLSDYEFLQLAGKGQFAEVWQVREKPTGRVVAFKQLLLQWESHPTARQLLENEAEIGQQIRSPYVVRVLGAQTETAPFYSLLEWLDGTSLEQLLEIQPQFSERRAIWIARQAAQGLLDLSEAGFSHGDVKPANICLLEDGRLKLLDLGFARPLQNTASEGGNEGKPASLTGTPEYLAPEALTANPVDLVAKDIYSLGVLLYRMLAGRLPFQSESLPEILRQQQRSVAAPLRSLAPHVTRETIDLVERLLAKQPLRRGVRWQDVVRELVARELAVLS